MVCVYYVKCIIPKTTGNKASLCFCKLLCTCFFFAIFLFLQYFVVLFSQISKWSACTNGNVQFRALAATKPDSDDDDGKNNQLSVWRAFQMSMSTCEMLPQGATMWKLGPGHSIIDS